MLLGGVPLIVHSIRAALAASSITRTVVSTDSAAIAAVASRAGAEVPFRRPAKLATDSATTADVVIHAIKTLEQNSPVPDIIVVLQPTSPLRVAADIDGAVELLHSTGAPSIVSISEVDHPVDWLFRLGARGRLTPLVISPPATRRQEAKKAYRLNGAVYVIRREALRRWRALRGPRTLGYPMPRERSTDIDEPFDLLITEATLARTTASAGREHLPREPQPARGR